MSTEKVSNCLKKSIFILAKNTVALNIFIRPEFYRDAKKSYVRNLTEIGFYKVPFDLLRKSRYKLNDHYLNLYALYEFECEKTVVTSFKEDDFFLLKFDLKLKLANWTVPDDVKIFFDSSGTILIKPGKTSAPSDLKEKSFLVKVKRLKNFLRR